VIASALDNRSTHRQRDGEQEEACQREELEGGEAECACEQIFEV